MSTFAARFDGFTHIGSQYELWNRPNWAVADMPSQAGKVVLVTGANSGTGFVTAAAYFNRGATVYVACRDAGRAAKAMEDIKKGGIFGYGPMTYTVPADRTSGGTLNFVQLDLSDLDSVERAALELLQLENKIDILFANAGIMDVPPTYTKQGYSIQFGTNLLGHQRLISLLLPALLRASPARVIVTSSFGHLFAPPGGVDYASVVEQGTPLSPLVEYAQSKWGDIALAKWLNWHHGQGAQRKDGEIIATSVHPGLIMTNLTAGNAKYSFSRDPSKQWLVLELTDQRRFFMTPEQGAHTQIWASALPLDRARELSGRYLTPYQHVGKELPSLHDHANVERLWDWCEEQMAERNRKLATSLPLQAASM